VLEMRWPRRNLMFKEESLKRLATWENKCLRSGI
jgi:hypothetical protein